MKSKDIQPLFSEIEQKQIRQAVESAEATTSGEIVTMVVDHSDSYREAETLGAVFFAGMLALICAILLRHVTIWTYIPLVFLFFLPFKTLLRRFPPLKLPFVGGKRIAEAVRERAVRTFLEKRLYKTREENGVLIFISILERKVWILADRGIHRKIPHGDWQALALQLSTGIRGGEPCAALCRVIAKCGEILAEHFPKRPDDINELPDDLIA
jgi:putative membrane protein